MQAHTVGYFTIGAQKPGAVTFQCTLTVHAGYVSGMGHVAQAISPPLNTATYVSGTSALIESGADTTQIISLTGHEFPTPMPPNPKNVECTIMLDSRNAARNLASLSYIDEQGQWVKLNNQAVKVTWQHAPH